MNFFHYRTSPFLPSHEIETLTNEIDRLEQINGQLNTETLSLQKEVNKTEGAIMMDDALCSIESKTQLQLSSMIHVILQEILPSLIQQSINMRS